MEPLAPPPPSSPLERARAFQQLIFRLTPRTWVTWALIGINFAVFAAITIAGVDPINPTVKSLIAVGANYGPLTAGGQWWRLGSSMFLHIGVVHILVNMLSLWSLGRMSERLLGNWNFLLLYLFAGICGSFAATVVHPLTTSAGASGAIFGLAGALLAIVVARGRSLPPGVLQVQRLLVIIGVNLAYGARATGIDMAAHVGGLVGGFLAALLVSHPFTEAGAATRPRRGLILLGLGALLTVGGILALRPAENFEGELEAFGAIEHEVLATFNQAVEKSRRREITDAELQRVIEGEMLPRWAKGRAILEKIGPMPPPQQKLRDMLLRYSDARAEGWTLIDEGIGKGGDGTLMARGQQREKDAEAMMKQWAADAKKDKK